MRSSEKEPGQNGAAGAPWLLDPPKEKARAEASEALEEELDRLARGVADEVKKSEKAPAAVIIAGGLDQAKAYVPPTSPSAQPRAKTVEMARVRIAKGVDPRQAETQRVDRAAAARIAGRKGLVPASSSGLGAEAGEMTAEGAAHGERLEGTPRAWGWMLGGALGVALMLGVALVIVLLRGPGSGPEGPFGAATAVAGPSATAALSVEPSAAPFATAALSVEPSAAPFATAALSVEPSAAPFATAAPSAEPSTAPVAGTSAAPVAATVAVSATASGLGGPVGPALSSAQRAGAAFGQSGSPQGRPPGVSRPSKPSAKPTATPELSE